MKYLLILAALFASHANSSNVKIPVTATITVMNAYDDGELVYMVEDVGCRSWHVVIKDNGNIRIKCNPVQDPKTSPD